MSVCFGLMDVFYEGGLLFQMGIFRESFWGGQLLEDIWVSGFGVIVVGEEGRMRQRDRLFCYVVVIEFYFILWGVWELGWFVFVSSEGIVFGCKLLLQLFFERVVFFDKVVFCSRSLLFLRGIVVIYGYRYVGVQKVSEEIIVFIIIYFWVFQIYWFFIIIE